MGEFDEDVLMFVETVPSGRVVTYGLVADALGRGGPRQVGRTMALEGQAVPWWRVVRADGTLPAHLMTDAQARWRTEGTPVVRGRVDMARALWTPDAEPPPGP